MDIRNPSQLKETAARRLEQAQFKKQIVLIYAGITIGLSALVTILTYFLSNQISQTGGLSNMGTRTILSTLQSLLPIVQNMILLCLELGFLNAMIRMSRGLYTSPQSLRAGMSRFWAAVRCALLLSFRYLMAGIGSFYLATMIFGLLPLSNRAAQILMPLVEQMTVLGNEIVIDNATAMALTDAMIPMFVIFGIILLLIMVPMFYRYRLANYILMDKPVYGALMAITESKLLMRRNGFAMFRVDLSLWWYYLLTAVSAAICYADVILKLLGMPLPFSETVNYFLPYVVFLAVQFGIYYFFANRVGVTYALAYEALKPEEKPTEGVVLGNIFQT